MARKTSWEGDAWKGIRTQRSEGRSRAEAAEQQHKSPGLGARLVHQRSSQRAKGREAGVRSKKDEAQGAGAMQILHSFTVVLRTLIFNLGERTKNHCKVLSKRTT